MRVRLFIILLLIACICSCTDKPEFSGDIQDEEKIYTTGSLQVFLDNPEITTRTGWEYDAYFPDGDIESEAGKMERWQHNLSIAYFDKDFLLEYFIVKEDLTNDAMIAKDVYENSANVKKEYTAIPLGIGGVPMTTGIHYFYVLANLPPPQLQQLKEFCNNKAGILTKDEFEKLTATSLTIEDITKVFYTSNDGRVYKPRCSMTNITSPAPHYMADRSQTTGINQLYPEVNNLNMKIGKSFAKVSVAYIPKQTNGTLEEIKYRIVNDPTQMYLLSNIFNKQVHTPHYDIQPGSDFEEYFSTYFNADSHIAAGDTLNSTEYELNTTNIPLYKNNFSWRPANTDPANPRKSYAYCMENGNKTPLQGNSTMVLVSARYKPEKWLNLDGTEGEKSSDGTFWRIRNANGYLPGYYNEKPVVRGSREVVKYNEGITYYPIWLQTDGKYMVERNHYYKLAITEIKSAGSPTPEGVMTAKNDPVEYSDNITKSTTPGQNLPEAATAIVWEQNN